MSVVFWDTNLFVYWLQDHPEFAPQVATIRERMLERGDRLCTSAMTLGELLAAPYSAGDARMAALYKTALAPPTVDLIGFDVEAADLYAQVRAGNRWVAPADAIQLACAARRRVDLFLTNDRRLAKAVVPGIQFIGGLDINVL